VTARVQPGGLGLVRRSPTELVVVPTLDSWEARQFPAHVVADLRLKPRRLIVGLVLGVLLAALGAAAVAPDLVPAWVPDAVRGRADGVAILGTIALGIGMYGWGHPVGHVIAACGVLPGLLAGGSVRAAAVVVVVQAALAVLAWRGWAARRRWWARLDALNRRHRYADGTVVELQKSDRSTSDSVRYWLWVASPDVPGTEWLVESETSMRHRPAAGQPVRIWYHPDDHEAAVLCVPEDMVGGRARFAAQAATAREEVAAAARTGDADAVARAYARQPWPLNRPPRSGGPARPRTGPVGVGLAVLLAVLAALTSGPARVDLPAPAAWRVLALVAAVGVAVLLHRRGDAVALGIATVLGQVLASAGGSDARAAAGATVLLGVLAVVTARARRPAPAVRSSDVGEVVPKD
jgi:hypothetical protein